MGTSLRVALWLAALILLITVPQTFLSGVGSVGADEASKAALAVVWIMAFAFAVDRIVLSLKGSTKLLNSYRDHPRSREEPPMT